MAKDVRSLSRGSRLAWGFVCIAIGCYPIAISFGLVPFDDAPLNAPQWVVAGAGIAFVIAGLMILLAHHPRANDFLAGVLCMLFGFMGAWVALFSSSAGFSGGWFFLSDEQNETIGRWVFGVGAVVSFAVAAWAFRRASQSSR